MMNALSIIAIFWLKYSYDDFIANYFIFAVITSNFPWAHITCAEIKKQAEIFECHDLPIVINRKNELSGDTTIESHRIVRIFFNNHLTAYQVGICNDLSRHR